jgi:hypothetical protein
MKMLPAFKPRPAPFTVLMFACILLVASCSSPSRDADSVDEERTAPEAPSLEEAMLVQSEDRRQTVLNEMGAPDVFSIRFEELEGQVVRWESWSYFDFDSAFDFVDGELLWTIDVEPVPDGSIYAHFYDPRDFQAYMSVAQVRSLLEGQELEQVDLSEGDIAGGLLLAGDQIMLGFDQDRLVFVETFLLAPSEDDELAGFLPSQESSLEPPTATPEATAVPPTSEPPTPEPTPILAPVGSPTNTAIPGQPAPLTNGVLVISDDFEATERLASPLFSQDFMSFSHVDGKGRLESRFPQGVIVATYSSAQMQDFIAEFELSVDNPAPGLKTGLIFRSEDAPGGLDYYYNFVLFPEESRVGLEVWKDAQWTPHETYPIPEALRPSDQTYRVRIEAEGSLFRVFLNGSFVAEFTDSRINEAGIFGLSLVSTAPPESVSFDNLRIYELP